MKLQNIPMVLFAAAAILSFSSTAYADPKPWVFGWGDYHWDHQDFVPYLEEGKHPHNSQWDESQWKPEHWVSQRGDTLNVIRDLYFADILRGQYVDDDIPVLEVGPAFYMLGGEDKRRVVTLVDSVYEITTSKENGMFKLVDWRTDQPIGAYTQYGLQLQ